MGCTRWASMAAIPGRRHRACKILTGWTIHRPNQPARAIAENRGSAVFLSPIHQPGAKTLLGQTYGEDGPREAETVLNMLAAASLDREVHRDQARQAFHRRRSAGRCGCGFADTFRTTGGDPPRSPHGLIDLEGSLERRGKYRSPYDWTVATFRAFGAVMATAPSGCAGAEPAGQSSISRLAGGWPDDSASWLAPEALLARNHYASGWQSEGRERSAEARRYDDRTALAEDSRPRHHPCAEPRRCDCAAPGSAGFLRR